MKTTPIVSNDLATIKQQKMVLVVAKILSYNKHMLYLLTIKYTIVDAFHFFSKPKRGQSREQKLNLDYIPTVIQFFITTILIWQATLLLPGLWKRPSSLAVVVMELVLVLTLSFALLLITSTFLYRLAILFGGKGNFKQTLTAVVVSNWSLIFHPLTALMPFFFGYQLILLTIFLKQIHHLHLMQAIVVVLIPSLVFIFLLLLLGLMPRIY